MVLGKAQPSMACAAIGQRDVIAMASLRRFNLGDNGFAIVINRAHNHAILSRRNMIHDMIRCVLNQFIPF